MGLVSSKQQTDLGTSTTSRWSLGNLLAKFCCSLNVNNEDTYAYAPPPQEVEPALLTSNKNDTNNNSHSVVYQQTPHSEYPIDNHQLLKKEAGVFEERLVSDGIVVEEQGQPLTSLPNVDSKSNCTSDTTVVEILSGDRIASGTAFRNEASVNNDITSFVQDQPPKTDDPTLVHNWLTLCSSDGEITSPNKDNYGIPIFRQKFSVGYMVNMLKEQHGQLKIQTIRCVWPRMRNKYDRRYLYVTIRRLLEPRYHDKNLTNAKQNWHTRRQAALEQRRQRCQEAIQRKTKLLELRLAGPGIPCCGQHKLGFNLIPGVAFRPVMQDGAPMILGRGRSGQVDLVYDESGYLMAKKTLNMETQESSQIALLKEVQALLAVQEEETFPTLIGVVYAFPNTVSFLMEYVGDWNTYKSTTLWDQVVSSDYIGRDDWLMLVQDIGRGLKVLHGKGLIHCDLHSYNVLVCHPVNSQRPRAKIIDLGNATPRAGVISHLGELRSEEKEDIYNNYNHAAPEVVEGESFYTVQSDIYAFGRILENVALYRGINELVPLSDACLCRNPMDRCTIGHVLRGIGSILQYGSTGTSV